jgi:hypothetical protein
LANSSKAKEETEDLVGEVASPLSKVTACVETTVVKWCGGGIGKKEMDLLSQTWTALFYGAGAAI